MKKLPHSRCKDITGLVYGKLTVISYHGKSVSGKLLWDCICNCGNNVTVAGTNLKSGNTRSCGCGLNRHGMSRTPTYKSWEMMIQRCTNERYDNYKYYGGAGITVSDDWRDFEVFLKDMGERPLNTSLDRIDPTKGYYKGNCRWANISLQALNKNPESSGKSGRRGVYYHKASGKWTASIQVRGDVHYLGLFENFSEAVKVRKQEEDKFLRQLEEEDAS